MKMMSPVAGVHEVVIDIGGAPISFRTTDHAFRALLERRYAGFLSPGLSAFLTFDIDLIAPVASSGECDIQVSSSDCDWTLLRGDFSAEWSSERRRGRIRQSANPYAIDSILRIVHTIILAHQGGFLLHSSSAVRNGKAFLFSGLSGAGKTTIARLAPADAELLTDEISYVRRSEAQYHAFGTPFFGDLGKPGANSSAPVAALYFLCKAPSNSIDPIGPGEAVRLLMRNILFFAHDATLVDSVFRSACTFVAEVAVFRLSFFPDQRVWDLIG